MGDEYIQAAIRRAVYSIYGKDYNPEHKHSKRCLHLIKDILSEDEKTIMEVHQSYLGSISPHRVILTNKRLILIRPSFWKLYTGHNLLSPTQISYLPYHQLVSVMMSRGVFLSSINIFKQGFAQNDSAAAQSEGIIDGVDTDDAIKFTALLEEIIESIPSANNYASSEQQHRNFISAQNRDEQAPNMVTLDQAKQLVKRGSRFVWLGVEPLYKIATLLGVEESNLVEIGIKNIEKYDNKDIAFMKGSILVCYNSTTSSHLSKLIKERYGIDTYVLEGGLKSTVIKMANSW